MPWLVFRVKKLKEFQNVVPYSNEKPKTIMLGDPAIITTMQDLKDSFGNPAANVKKEKKIL